MNPHIQNPQFKIPIITINATGVGMKEAAKPIKRYYLSPQTGNAFSVQKGQIIRVIDVEGGQVSDLICFARRDIEEYLASGRTIDYNEKLFLSTGDILYSNRSNPMLAIIDDPVGKHDFLNYRCTPIAVDVYET